MQLFECLERLIVIPEAFVDQSKVIDSFDTVSLNTDSLKEKFLRAIEILIHKQSVALVHQRLRVVSVMLYGQIGEMFRILEVVLQEVQERNVVRSHGHHDLVLLFEALEALDSLLDLLVLDEVDRLGDFHLGFDLGQVGRFEGLDDVVVPGKDVLLDERRDKLGSLADVAERLFFLLLEVLFERI